VGVDADTTAAETSAAELERLHARIDELERERAELAARTAVLVARAQERTYWLDRWQLDLDALVRHPLRELTAQLRRLARKPLRMVRAKLGRPPG
jgi:hypothetical protein